MYPTNRYTIFSILAVCALAFTGCAHDDTSGHAATSPADIESEVATVSRLMEQAADAESFEELRAIFDDRGYIQRSDLAINYDMESTIVLVVPFDSGVPGHIAAIAVRFEDGVALDASAIDVNADSVAEDGIMRTGEMLVVDTTGLQTFDIDDADPRYQKSQRSWWSCFWRSAGAGCIGALGCYWAGPGIWACVAAVCGVSAAWSAVACL